MNEKKRRPSDALYAYPQQGDRPAAPASPEPAEENPREKLQGKDKKQILILAVADLALFLFIAVWLIVSGVRAAKLEKRLASFDPAVEYYNPAGALAALQPSYREAAYPAGIQPAMAPLYSLNNETVGWLRLPGTGIDHAVVQGKTNDDYLHANFFRRYDKRTRIFFGDSRNTFSASLGAYSPVTIIYGHHLSADERIFAELENYMKVEYYKAHPTIEFDTLYGKTYWKIFGCFICSVNAEKEPVFYYWDTDLAAGYIPAFCGEVLRRSGFINPALTDFSPSDKILCLSTCTYQIRDDRDNRCVVMARLVRSGESLDTDVSGAYQNPNCRMPHAWYEQNGMTDPFVGVPVFSVP